MLIPLALGLLALAVWALLWAIKTGQFDDLESHGWSVVLDDDQKPPPPDDEDSDINNLQENPDIGSEKPAKNAADEFAATGNSRSSIDKNKANK